MRAEHALSNLEKTQGFTASLLWLASSPHIAPDVQWLAIVYAKNQVNRYWKQILPRYFVIDADEKIVIRAAALPLALSSNVKISSQAAQLISKIVFVDYPRHWPDFLNLLVQSVSEKVGECIESGNRALMLLNFVLKSLSSKKLLADKKEFFQISSAFFPILSAIWFGTCKGIHDCPNSATIESRDRYVICCKILRRILSQGSTKLFTNAPAVQLLGDMTHSAENWAAHLLHSSHHLLDAVPDDRCPYFLLKCLLHVLDQHSLAMAAHAERLACVCAALAQRPASGTAAAGRTDTARLRTVCLHILSVAVSADTGRTGPSAAAASGWRAAAGQEAAGREAVARSLGGGEGIAGLTRCLVVQVAPPPLSPPPPQKLLTMLASFVLFHHSVPTVVI